MQSGFDFGAGAELAAIRERLQRAFGAVATLKRRDPTSQLVRSLLGSKTLDAVSLAAYQRLRSRHPGWNIVAAQAPADILPLIAPVTLAPDKAEFIVDDLRRIENDHPDFDLGFLEALPVEEALCWLQKLPGVGPKVSAAVLNFSTLAKPAFVVDTHVRRIVHRFGFVARPETQHVYDAVMTATDGWSALQLADLHVLLKQLGQRFCHFREPNCAACPLRQSCRTGLSVLH